MNKDSKNDIMNTLSEKLGKSAEDIESCARSGKIDSLMSKLSASQQEKVKALLSDPEETQKLLSNPQVQAIIRKLRGNG